MEEKYFELIEWAQQPRQQVWRKWVRLLTVKIATPLSVEDIREYKPSIDIECEPLFGQMVQTPEGRVNKRPPLAVSARIFLRGIAIVKTFRDKNDLMRLAVYRREVTDMRGHARVDRSFYRLVEAYFPELEPAIILELSDRMPPRSQIKEQLIALARRRNRKFTELLAAE